MTAPFRSSPTVDRGITWVVPPAATDRRLVAMVNRSTLTARVYDSLWRRVSTTVLTRGGYTVAREIDEMTSWTTGQGRTTILDLGCGSGHYLRALRAARDDLDLYGVDESMAFLRTATRRASNADVRARWVWASALDLPFLDQSFDAIACGGTPNEFADPRQAFQEAWRVTARGGRAYWMLATRREGVDVGSWAARRTGLWVPSPDEALTVAEAAGWTIQRADLRPPLLVVRTMRAA